MTERELIQYMGLVSYEDLSLPHIALPFRRREYLRHIVYPGPAVPEVVGEICHYTFNEKKREV